MEPARLSFDILIRREDEERLPKQPNAGLEGLRDYTMLDPDVMSELFLGKIWLKVT